MELKARLELLCFLEAYIAPWRIDRLVSEHLDVWWNGSHGWKEGSDMARRKERPNVQFVGVRVSEGDRAKFKKWSVRESFHWLDEIEHQIQAGLKIGASWDGKNECFIVSVTNWIDGDLNYGWCFSTRNATLEKAFELTLYKLLVVLDGVEWSTVGSKDDFG